MTELPKRVSRKVEHIDANLYRCVDEYEKFTIEALGTTEELAIQNATTDELIREYMQDHQQNELTKPPIGRFFNA